jgi:SAM-dependent methyltransferase
MRHVNLMLAPAPEYVVQRGADPACGHCLGLRVGDALVVVHPVGAGRCSTNLWSSQACGLPSAAPYDSSRRRRSRTSLGDSLRITSGRIRRPERYTARPSHDRPEGGRKAKGMTMFSLVAESNDSQEVTSSQMDSPWDSSRVWRELAPDYERARTREDSLDRLVEWPAQRDLLGDVTGRSVLDVGCGNGGKLAELVGDGATASVGVDVTGNFLSAQPPGLEFIRGDLSELDSVPGLAGRTFDRILFLQSFGYAKNPVRTLQAARAMLADDGFILLTKTQPIRYAVERAEQNETSLGEEYFSTAPFSYLSGWNDQITLTKRPYTISDLINVFSAAGLWIETAIEPQLSEDARRRYPHKQAWMNKYLGILIFKLRPHPGR